MQVVSEFWQRGNKSSRYGNVSGLNVSLAQVRRAVERGPVHPGLPRVRRLRRRQAVR